MLILVVVLVLGNSLVCGNFDLFWVVLGDSVIILGCSRPEMGKLRNYTFFPPMRWLPKTLHPSPAAPAPLAHFRTHCGPTSQMICPPLIQNKPNYTTGPNSPSFPTKWKQRMMGGGGEKRGRGYRTDASFI